MTNPFNMASLFGVGILQFLGKPFPCQGIAMCYFLVNIFRNAGGLAAPDGRLQSRKEEEEERPGIRWFFFWKCIRVIQRVDYRIAYCEIHLFLQSDLEKRFLYTRKYIVLELNKSNDKRSTGTSWRQFSIYLILIPEHWRSNNSNVTKNNFDIDMMKSDQ